MNASASYAELFITEGEHAAAARERANELGVTPVGPGAGAALAFLAAAVGTADKAAGSGAKSAVEVGTGTGVSGLHLFAGMAETGILTSIDPEPECQRAAKQAFSNAGVAPGRARLIAGRALDVLPRLTDAAYDVVLIDGSPQDYPDCVTESLRLLRPGGIVILAHALGGGAVADPTQRDPDTVAIRDAGRMLRDDEQLVPTLIPVSDGLIAAVRR